MAKKTKSFGRGIIERDGEILERDGANIRKLKPQEIPGDVAAQNIKATFSVSTPQGGKQVTKEEFEKEKVEAVKLTQEGKQPTLSVEEVQKRREFVEGQELEKTEIQKPVKEEGVEVDEQGNRFVVNPKTQEKIKLPLNQTQFEEAEQFNKGVDTAVTRSVQIAGAAIAISAAAPLLASMVSATGASAIKTSSLVKSIFWGGAGVVALGETISGTIDKDVASIIKDTADILEAVKAGAISPQQTVELMNESKNQLSYLEKASFIQNKFDYKNYIKLGLATETKIKTAKRDVDTKIKIINGLVLSGAVPI